MNKINFASDNYAGIHPDILKAIQAVNEGPSIAYGGDPITAQAERLFQDMFGSDTVTHFVLNGTAANVLSIAALNQPYQAVICTERAHIQVDECGAVEKINGNKLFLTPTKDGKFCIDAATRYLARKGDQHYAQANIISISQCTELGTVYTRDEIKSIADFAKENNLYLHVDGARIANAAVSLKQDLRAITCDLGVDVLSFGGTKNGMMLGEAVVFFNPALAKNFHFIRKQNMQLASKMRFISAQFVGLLSHDLWRRNARHANEMATLLLSKLSEFPEITITQTVESNVIFAAFPQSWITKLQDDFYFYVWDQDKLEVRLMMSYSTTPDEINLFVEKIRQLR